MCRFTFLPLQLKLTCLSKLLQDSDEESGGDGVLKIPAAVAALPLVSYDDVPDRPPPNKKHKCLQVIVVFYHFYVNLVLFRSVCNFSQKFPLRGRSQAPTPAPLVNRQPYLSKR